MHPWYRSLVNPKTPVITPMICCTLAGNCDSVQFLPLSDRIRSALILDSTIHVVGSPAKPRCGSRPSVLIDLITLDPPRPPMPEQGEHRVT